MSLLPETITVKRKRAQDGALDFLRFEDAVHKRQKGRADDDTSYVYERRKKADVESAESPSEQQTLPFVRIAAPREEPSWPDALDGPPVVHTSVTGDENRPIKALPLRLKKSSGRSDSAASIVPSPPRADLPAPPAPALLIQDMRNARRFHLSRSSENALSGPSDVSGPRLAKKRSAVFVELGGPSKPAKRQALQDAVGHQTEHVHLPYRAKPVLEKDAAMTVTGVSTTTRKRPGARCRTRQQKLPPSLLDRRDADMVQLTEDMNLFMLDQMAQKLAVIEEAKMKERALAEKARFRPKGQAPGQRIFERDPVLAQLEQTLKDGQAAENANGDAEMHGSDEDDDYVLETYVRVPASRLTDTVPAQQIGLLVFDNEPDRLEFFYGEEHDSDDQVLEDEDDENAENYYTADYPDDELESDDEMGANSYRYTTQNTWDDEEFDRTWDEGCE